MSTARESVPPTDARASKSSNVLRNCWSCRILSGGGLILSGLYVLYTARKTMALRAPSTIGLMAQITFGANLVALGVVVVANPTANPQKRPI